MNQAKYIFRIKRQIKSAKLTKKMYPEFSGSQDKIIAKLEKEIKTLGHFNKIK